VYSLDETLRRILPVLSQLALPAKLIASESELAHLNSALRSERSQIGKAVTVYASDCAAARRAGRALDVVTRGLRAPSIPYEARVSPPSVVYFRYGSFVDGTVLGPRGGRHRDDRTAMVPPSWVRETPFPHRVRPPFFEYQRLPGRLGRRFLPLALISGRGKGCVSLVVDAAPPNEICIAKIGVRDGELGHDGIDGRTRVEREVEWLRHLRRVGVPVPRVIATHRCARATVAILERPSDVSLAELLASSARKPPDAAARVPLALAVAEAVRTLHDQQVVWGDIKPHNILVGAGPDETPAAWLIDFEGAQRCGGEGGWGGSPGYVSPEASSEAGTTQQGDVYALGVTIAQIAHWSADPRSAITSSGNGTELALSRIAASCLAQNPNDRPRGGEVADLLRLAANETLPFPVHSRDCT
jgi:hypothetical protein